MNRNRRFIPSLYRGGLLCAAIALLLGNNPATAQNASRPKYDPDQGFGTGAGYLPDNGQVQGQSLSGSNGDTFMEEVVPDKPKPKPKPVPIDLSRVGVSVDPHGNIVPTKDAPDAPWAQSGVKPFYNKVETSTTMPYLVPNAYPYGYGYPGYGAPLFGYPGYGYQGGWRGILGAAVGAAAGALAANSGFYSPYGYNTFGNPYYGNPYFGNPYSGSPYFANPLYPGYAPYSLGYMTTGNSATFLSNDPVTGAPLPQGNSQSNFTTGGGTFSPAPWLPSTTYNQSSMWKAFNLAF
ncbi:MAG: hypothetical protein JST01_12900 [Cyanobacteria bacterium SZAS TMP-1]|nr:hypothetical protein [Cyanobacteria bacterium SZAS TMP-1]